MAFIDLLVLTGVWIAVLMMVVAGAPAIEPLGPMLGSVKRNGLYVPLLSSACVGLLLVGLPRAAVKLTVPSGETAKLAVKAPAFLYPAMPSSWESSEAPNDAIEICCAAAVCAAVCVVAAD